MPPPANGADTMPPVDNKVSPRDAPAGSNLLAERAHQSYKEMRGRTLTTTVTHRGTKHFIACVELANFDMDKITTDVQPGSFSLTIGGEITDDIYNRSAHQLLTNGLESSFAAAIESALFEVTKDEFGDRSMNKIRHVLNVEIPLATHELRLADHLPTKFNSNGQGLKLIKLNGKLLVLAIVRGLDDGWDGAGNVDILDLDALGEFDIDDLLRAAAASGDDVTAGSPAAAAKQFFHTTNFAIPTCGPDGAPNGQTFVSPNHPTFGRSPSYHPGFVHPQQAAYPQPQQAAYPQPQPQPHAQPIQESAEMAALRQQVEALQMQALHHDQILAQATDAARQEAAQQTQQIYESRAAMANAANAAAARQAQVQQANHQYPASEWHLKPPAVDMVSVRYRMLEYVCASPFFIYYCYFSSDLNFPSINYNHRALPVPLPRPL